ncbi:MAG: hypothetical protein FWB93_04180 [Oscillospiraceae bacterium]|nr:hypothetical protein [Oscillospiraceae bacterium]
MRKITAIHPSAEGKKDEGIYHPASSAGQADTKMHEKQTARFCKSPSAGGRGRCANSTSQRGSDCDPGAVGDFPTDGVGVKCAIRTDTPHLPPVIP